jgi:hypothetical protein
MLKIFRLAAIASLVLGTVVMGAGAAGAAAAGPDQPSTCTGTLTAPGLLTGTYHGDVVATGVCAVYGGAAVIKGNLIVAPGASLVATFGLNDVTGTGTSGMTVFGNVEVRSGAVLAMGCEPAFDPCTDGPDGTSQSQVFGNVDGSHALGIIIHASTIKGNVRMIGGGGGGGVACSPPYPGIFASAGTAPFSDSEDTTIGGNLTIIGLHTCWLGALRNSVHGNVLVAGNTMDKPAADVIVNNVINGSIACYGNSPAVQYGVFARSPNLVRHYASGECAFDVKKPDPFGTGPLEPISVKA